MVYCRKMARCGRLRSGPCGASAQGAPPGRISSAGGGGRAADAQENNGSADVRRAGGVAVGLRGDHGAGRAGADVPPADDGGPAGDLLVTVSVASHPTFRREGYDIRCEIPVSFYQAVNGDELTVPTIDGTVAYTLPEGTQPGTVFRLRGKGVQRLNSRGRGDQYVTVVVEVPKGLTREQKVKLREFEESLTEKQSPKKKSFGDKLKDMFK